MKLLFNQAGLLCMSVSRVSFHLAVKPSYWVWGYKKIRPFTIPGIDHCEFYMIGLGPMFMVSWYNF